MREFFVTMQVTVEVKCEDVVIRRPVENIDGFRERFYGLRSERDVFEHLAYNAIFNGMEDGQRLDGWADLAPEALQMRVTDSDFWGADERTVQGA